MKLQCDGSELAVINGGDCRLISQWRIFRELREKIANDGATPVADRMKHIRDLEVAEALDQLRKEEKLTMIRTSTRSEDRSGTPPAPPRSTQASVKRA